MTKIKELMVKYREIIVYVIVGGLTTVFCWTICWLMERFVFDPNDSLQNFAINTISWVAGVSFAYPLNRKWVFRSTNPNVVKEYMSFAGSRLSTWGLDVVLMWLFVNVIPLTKPLNKLASAVGFDLNETQQDKLNYWFAKIFISSVLVMIANYIFSKLLIFKKKDTDKGKK